jgi:hypothetical protein
MIKLLQWLLALLDPKPTLAPPPVIVQVEDTARYVEFTFMRDFGRVRLPDDMPDHWYPDGRPGDGRVTGDQLKAYLYWLVAEAENWWDTGLNPRAFDAPPFRIFAWEKFSCGWPAHTHC